MTQLTEKLEKHLRIAEKATQGPWCWEFIGEKSNACCVGAALDSQERYAHGQISHEDDFIVADFVCETHENPEDAAHIAANHPEVVRALVEVAKAAEGAYNGRPDLVSDWMRRINALRAALSHLDDVMGGEG